MDIVLATVFFQFLSARSQWLPIELSVWGPCIFSLDIEAISCGTTECDINIFEYVFHNSKTLFSDFYAPAVETMKG